MSENPEQECTFIERPFLPAFCDAFILAKKAGDEDSNSSFAQSLSRSSILASAFSIEAAANGALRQLSTSRSFREDIDRLPWSSKFEFLLLARNPNSTLDRGHSVFQKADEIFELRNRLAHGKTRHRSGKFRKNNSGTTNYEFNLDEEEFTNLMRIPKQSGEWKCEHALDAFRAVVDFLNYFFRDLCKFTVPEAQRFLVCEMKIGETYPQLIEQAHIHTIGQIKKDLDIEIGFLGF